MLAVLATPLISRKVPPPVNPDRSILQSLQQSEIVQKCGDSQSGCDSGPGRAGIVRRVSQ